MIDLDEAAAIAVSLEARWEGFRSKPYLCPANVPTKGFGFTHNRDGSRVTLLDPPMTREEATELLRYFTQTIYLPAAHRLCPGVETAGQLGALTDFCYNLGERALRGSTLRRRVNAREWDLVPDEFRKWVRAGGRVLRGLVLRREAEIAYL